VKLGIEALLRAYRGGLSPNDVIEGILERAERWSDHRIWITPPSRDGVAPHLARLAASSPAELPLYGVPFAIKDNIDLAGTATTVGCPAIAYRPGRSAAVVQRLIDAGAIPLGKTNMDQFATGLSGTRTPYGATRNALYPTFIAGGSSSGSAVAVAAGLASFALGTDTAGSGRVPAALNGIVGLKPSRGAISTDGVYPACRSLDCVSIFALGIDDAHTVFDRATGQPTASAPLPRGIVGAPTQAALEFFGDDEARLLFERALDQLARLGISVMPVDFEPFREAARLLYEGPWIAERALACLAVLDEHPEAMEPAVRAAIDGWNDYSAADAFAAMHRLQELKAAADAVLATVDCIVTPTVPTTYSIDDMRSDPVRLNANLGYYTNFVNLLDYAALAIPFGALVGRSAWGVTLCGRKHEEELLVHYGKRLLGEPVTPRGTLDIAVCGAHLSGLPLNTELTTRGAMLVAKTRTASRYRLFALAGGPPYRPGIVRDAGGAAIDIEVWRMPLPQIGSFLAGIPHPLGIGTIELADGTWVKGFVCETSGTVGAEDVTAFGGWRAYLARSR